MKYVMENKYVQNLNRLEFVVTMACTGMCKHCSEGAHRADGAFLDGSVSADVVRKVAERYKIQSLMTFGGEPLLQWETVCSIHAAATEAQIPQRQLITNGFFTKDSENMRLAVRELRKSGVNAVLLSVDAFHQETIPLETVKEFADCVKSEGIFLRTNPAWLVSREAENPYNGETHRILEEFKRMGVEEAEGNTIFPSGNALIYLKEYFDENTQMISPYEEDPEDIRAICIGADGKVLGGNIFQTDILDILEHYRPSVQGKAKV